MSSRLSRLSLKQAANLKIVVRLSIAFGLMACFVLIIFGIARLQGNEMRAAAIVHSTNVVRSMSIIRQITDDVYAGRLLELEYLRSASRAESTELENKIQQDRARVASNLRAYGRAVADPEDQTAYENLQLQVAQYWHKQDTLITKKSDAKAVPADYASALSDSLQAFDKL